MKESICLAPVSHLKELNNLFIELTEKNCNLRCKHCWINFPLKKNIKDFIQIDTIKKALNDTLKQNLNCIYLTGAEPMTHPDFNSILRLCLKKCNVCIFTNASCINEKKARFLKRVEEESNFEIIFKLSIDHYNEIKNDDIRGRGTYRQTMHAIKCLIKYGFNPILCITNYYKEPYEKLIEEFTNICSKIGFETTEDNFIINEYYDKNITDETVIADWDSLDCEYGRILTTKGVYSCPFLANDHRGRCGSSFTDFSHKTQLESPYCRTCIKNKKSMFSIDFSK
ncbi:radical SAM protein, partial [Spirochaetes bacterium]|nr:radical SAM protein [Candidatus Scatousia excrementipullorum]